MVKKGELGKIRKIVVQYPQGWLASALEKESPKEGGQMQAAWRTDPKQSGGAGCMGDIGTHCENLAEYISGLKITELCADLTIFVRGRRLDDDGNVLLRFNNGARGVLHASQVSIGEENNLAIWIYGEKKGLEWHQEHPNYLYVKFPNAPEQVGAILMSAPKALPPPGQLDCRPVTPKLSLKPLQTITSTLPTPSVPK